LPVNDATQHGEQFRLSLDFVEHHQLVLVTGKEIFRVAQPLHVRWRFQIKKMFLDLLN